MIHNVKISLSFFPLSSTFTWFQNHQKPNIIETKKRKKIRHNRRTLTETAYSEFRRVMRTTFGTLKNVDVVYAMKDG